MNQVSATKEQLEKHIVLGITVYGCYLFQFVAKTSSGNLYMYIHILIYVYIYVYIICLYNFR